MKLVDVLNGLGTGTYKVKVRWDGTCHLLGEEGYSLIHDLAAQVVGLYKWWNEDEGVYLLQVIVEVSTSTKDMSDAVARYANNDKPWRGILKYEEREEASVPYLAIVVR